MVLSWIRSQTPMFGDRYMNFKDYCILYSKETIKQEASKSSNENKDLY